MLSYNMIRIMHFSSYEFPLIMPRFACATIQEAFGTYWRWHWTSTLLTVINEVMIYSTSSSAIHTGMVCATGFPVMWTRTLGPHHSAINMQRVGKMVINKTILMAISLSNRSWPYEFNASIDCWLKTTSHYDVIAPSTVSTTQNAKLLPSPNLCHSLMLCHVTRS